MLTVTNSAANTLTPLLFLLNPSRINQLQSLLFFLKINFQSAHYMEHPDTIPDGLPLLIDTESLLLVKKLSQAIIFTHNHQTIQSLIFQIKWRLKGWVLKRRINGLVCSSNFRKIHLIWLGSDVGFSSEINAYEERPCC